MVALQKTVRCTGFECSRRYLFDISCEILRFSTHPGSVHVHSDVQSSQSYESSFEDSLLGWAGVSIGKVLVLLEQGPMFDLHNQKKKLGVVGYR